MLYKNKNYSRSDGLMLSDDKLTRAVLVSILHKMCNDVSCALCTYNRFPRVLSNHRDRRSRHRRWPVSIDISTDNTYKAV